MNKRFKASVFATVFATLFIGGLYLTRQPLPSEIEVSSPTVARPTATPAANPSKLKVKRLNLEPEQVIFINMQINEFSVETTIQKLQAAEANGVNDLYLVLDCPGGSVFDGARLISYIDASSINVHTVVYGLAASMCAQIFAHGKTRLMVDHATLMHHQASGGVQGDVKNMQHLLSFIDREVQKMDAYVADRAGISREAFDKMNESDLWIASDDAVAIGLADGLAIINVEGGIQPHSIAAPVDGKVKTKESSFKNPLRNFE